MGLLRDLGVVLLRVEGLQDLVEGVQGHLVAAGEPWDLADLEVEHDRGAEMIKGECNHYTFLEIYFPMTALNYFT